MNQDLLQMYEIVKRPLDQMDDTRNSQTRSGAFLFSAIMILLGLTGKVEFGVLCKPYAQLGILTLAVSIVALLYVLFPRGYSSVPRPSKVLEKWITSSNIEEVLDRIVKDMAEAYEDNRRVLKATGAALVVAYWSATIGLVTLAVSWYSG